jgi:hypothetical protein
MNDHASSIEEGIDLLSQGEPLFPFLDGQIFQRVPLAQTN